MIRAEGRQFKRAGASECIGAGYAPAEESKILRTRIDQYVWYISLRKERKRQCRRVGTR